MCRRFSRRCRTHYGRLSTIRRGRLCQVEAVENEQEAKTPSIASVLWATENRLISFLFLLGDPCRFVNPREPMVMANLK